ncbi:hypothetical protein [Streptosporangium sp. NPDC023615]|uniref:hypothetical protein n=1 Tax=Streptosporangium sp. NPDC023615 TaxID=3154794 RepID=UPI00342F97CB
MYGDFESGQTVQTGQEYDYSYVLRQFYVNLEELHKSANSPSMRKIANDIHRSKTIVGDLFSGRSIPPDPAVRDIIVYLGGDWSEWGQRVCEARRARARIRAEERSPRPARPWLQHLVIASVSAAIAAGVSQLLNAALTPKTVTQAPNPAQMPVAGRLHCAIVIVDSAPVYHLPDPQAGILREKTRQQLITYDEKHSDKRTKGILFRAVRTPSNQPQYHWMMIEHLKEIECTS